MPRAVSRDDIRTGVYGVIGHDIGYAQSPAIFRRVFDAFEWPAVYALYDLAPHQLPLFLRAAVDAQIRGLNITKPFKTVVIPHLHALDHSAHATGSVNTIAVRQDRLIGYNTDIDGVTAALVPHKRFLTGGSAVVFGAGGAARAVAYTLVSEYKMSKITLAARDRTKVRRLIHEISDSLPKRVLASAAFEPGTDLRDALAQAQLIVNATPLGSGKLIAKNPLPERFRCPKQTVVFDLVYSPEITKFMRAAKSAGCRHVIGGWPMLVAQADSAFRIWTGRRFPRDIHRSLLTLRSSP